jgi:hypothetical protein
VEEIAERVKTDMRLTNWQVEASQGLAWVLVLMGGVILMATIIAVWLD